MTTAVKERPILFSGPMVRAILEGRKTQTRRMIKPAPPSIDVIRKMSGSTFGLFNDYSSPPAVWRVTGPVWAVRDAVGQTEWKCPYGQVGDRLWVRESLHNENGLAVYNADGEIVEYTQGTYGSWLWTRDSLPSIHMPRKASRITLEITAVRAERLHDISEDDAIAEGVKICNSGTPLQSCWDYVDNTSRSPVMFGPIDSYWSLWNAINGDGAWDANPWVWVVEFQRVD